MKLNVFPVYVSLLAASTATFAAADGLSVPVSGWVADGKVIRPIVGIPGAAAFGEAMDLGFQPAAMRFGYKADYALAISSSGELILVRGLRAMSLQDTVLGTTLATNVVLNASQTAAVLISNSDSTLQIVTGLPDNPKLSQPISFADVGFPIRAAAIDELGANVIAGFSDGTNGEVDWFDHSGRRTLLTAASQPAALVYANSDNDIAVADRGWNQVLVIRNAKSSARELILAATAPDVVTPVALRVWNQNHLLVASADSSEVADLDLVQMTIAGKYPVPAFPSKLDPLSDPNVSLLNEPGANPSYVFVMSATPAAYFIPSR